MSAISRVISYFREARCEDRKETDLTLVLLAGPLSLLFTVALALQRGSNLDLLPLVVTGLILCTWLSFSGLVYSLFLLGLGALCKHYFFLEQHAWQLGIEGSIAIGFTLTAFAFDWMRAKEKHVQRDRERQGQMVKHLEEDLTKLRETAMEDQVLLHERLTGCQKELEEMRLEFASILVLNDVLRKTAAMPEVDVQEKNQRIATLLGEIEELKRCQPIDTANLLKELEAARAEKEQTYQINDSLIRRLAASAEKMKEIEEQPAMPAPYVELRKQFEEKKKILNETRKELFRADALLQAKQLEQESQNLDPGTLLEQLLIQMVVKGEEEREQLESENAILTEIVSCQKALS